jgi:hypothetical protein
VEGNRAGELGIREGRLVRLFDDCETVLGLVVGMKGSGEPENENRGTKMGMRSWEVG